MAAKIRDINKALAFFSLQATLKDCKHLFPEIKPYNIAALNYLVYLYMMSLLNKPVRLNDKGRMSLKLVGFARHIKSFEFLKMHKYVQVKPFYDGLNYVWLTEKSKKIVRKLLEEYEENVEGLSTKFRIPGHRRVRW